MEKEDLTVKQLRKMHHDLYEKVNDAILDFQQESGIEVKEILPTHLGDFIVIVHNIL